MKINYNVTGEKRKALAGAVSQELNAPMKYLGAPTFAYEVGGYRIDKSGMLEGEDDFGLVADLCGLYSFKAVGEEDMQTSGGSESEETCGLAIEMPREGFTEATIENLKRLIESKATLIKKAFGITEIPLGVSNETIRFPWFKGVADAEMVKAYTHFVT
ncbi:MAG: virulence protein, partial [Actinobacteria bacterium]|nr:virulence protein [Actinomycetota bacterium]